MSPYKCEIYMSRKNQEKKPKGCYILLIELNEDGIIAVGKLGSIAFAKNSYAYVGSAMSGLETRIGYHLRKNKSFHWHIDYLLDKAPVKEIILCQAEERLECTIAQALAQKLLSVPGFGSSDCKCRSHLYFSREKSELQPMVWEVLGNLGLADSCKIRPLLHSPKGGDRMAAHLTR
jgi:Uri superfamily endonuclease